MPRLIYHHTAQVAINLFRAYFVLTRVKLNGNLSYVAIVIENQTLAALVNRDLLNKFGVCICKT